ncbi:MAG: maleylpyruvate isomerase family mycothiol-dependent enzyme, partial [Acidimicrobiia bacterium]
FRQGVDELVVALRSLDPGAPTWHPFTVERVAAVWPRRQAHETSAHRWDLQTAVGAPDPIEPELASDGIDEYFEVAVPRLLKREGLAVPASSFHVHCTDVDGEWLVWSDDGAYRMKRAHEKGDAALRGPAEAILLRLWGRTSARADELSPVGDESALAAWLTFAGM